MRGYLHRGHTVTDIKYHFVWVTKYQYAVLSVEVGERLRDPVRQTCEVRGVTMVTGVVSKDHTYMSVRSRHPRAKTAGDVAADAEALIAIVCRACARWRSTFWPHS